MFIFLLWVKFKRIKFECAASGIQVKCEAGDIPKQWFFSNLASDERRLRVESEVPLPPRLTSSPITCLRPALLPAVRQVAINRSPGRSPNRPERRRAGLPAASASDSRVSSSRSGPDSRQRVRWPDRLGSLWPRLESFLTRRALLAVWGADADRSKLRGAKLVVPPVLESPHPRLEPHPSAQLCQRELLTDPSPTSKGEKPAQKKVHNLIGKKKGCGGILISDKYKLEEGSCQ